MYGLGHVQVAREEMSYRLWGDLILVRSARVAYPRRTLYGVLEAPEAPEAPEGVEREPKEALGSSALWGTFLTKSPIP
jgi:hypothetical protein